MAVDFLDQLQNCGKLLLFTIVPIQINKGAAAQMEIMDATIDDGAACSPNTECQQTAYQQLPTPGTAKGWLLQ